MEAWEQGYYIDLAGGISEASEMNTILLNP